MSRAVSTICWHCKHAVGGCSWSRKYIPVVGWTAEPTKINTPQKVMKQQDSFIVHACPLFQEG